MKIFPKIIIFYSLSFLFLSCNNVEKNRLLEYVDSAYTNVDFTNTIIINEEVNVIDFQYCYNGGGVGVGDFNDDGFPDLVFTGNQVSSKIYLNQKALKFLDISKESNFSTKDWVTGVSIVDINEDGLDDIYLSVGGANCNGDCDNLLFVNQGLNENGIPRFLEMAKTYGLNEQEYAQQTVFFDYDLDGDLDAYIVRNGNVKFDKNSPTPKKYFPKYLSDVLLRNDKIDTIKHPVFTNVSYELGTNNTGFGLGVGINDFNDDGKVDIYVSNDFITDDLLFLNSLKKNGTTNSFIESSKRLTGHQTYNAMGVDIADINNDLIPDILVLDMLPNNYQRLKTMVGAMNYDKYQLALKNNYSPQFMRNTLQLGSIVNEETNQIHYSDVSLLAKLSQTDWSWAPLIIDLDADGDKDIFITNGYGTDITNLDFINYTQQNNVFGTIESRTDNIKQLVKKQSAVKLQNFLFENTGDLNFNEVSTEWSKEKLSLSNGAAYADLDLDGDLDLIVNNINEKAFIIKNRASEKLKFHYLKLRLLGEKRNAKAIGAKVTLWDNGRAQVHYQSVVRGYLSSVEPIVYFGLEDNLIDSLEIRWPNGKITKKNNVIANQTIFVSIDDAKENKPSKHAVTTHLFSEDNDTWDFEHKENKSQDFVTQKLLLAQHSKNGPCITIANIDENIGDELLMGGSAGYSSSIWALSAENKFVQVQQLDSIFEDTDAIFFDYDGDNDLDLYIASGGSEFNMGSQNYVDRLYENKGAFNFHKTTNKIPETSTPTNCVKSFDYDKDGDLDLFIGSGMVPENYPKSSKSYMLENENGIFSKLNGKEFAKLGIVKDACWTDIDNDGWHDLVIVGDWMPIQVFKNHSGVLKKMQISVENIDGDLIGTNGWWRTISQGDFDNDGDMDFLLGNQGLNNFVNPSQEFPVHIYTNDYDKNGSIDPLVAVYYPILDKKRLMPLHSRDDIMNQLVVLKDKYKTYDQFSKVDFETLLDIKDLNKSTLKAQVFENSYLENLGASKFKLKKLPLQCQFGPVNSFLVNDFDQDGNIDALMAGNDFYTETHFGRYDALNGTLLKGDGTGKFEAISSGVSGFYAPHQTSNILDLTNKHGEKFVIVGQNNLKAKIFAWKKK